MCERGIERQHEREQRVKKKGEKEREKGERGWVESKCVCVEDKRTRDNSFLL